MKGKRGTFAKSSLRSLMKKSGAAIASGESVQALMHYLEERVKTLTASAIKYSRHAKRKKITQSDMQLAIDYYK